MAIDRILEGVDLTGAHTVLALVGALLAVYVMQLTQYEAEDRVDHWLIRRARRVGLALLSLAFLWSLTFSETRQWQPWPPEIMAIFAIDLLLAVRVAAIWARVRRTGRYLESESLRVLMRRARN